MIFGNRPVYNGIGHAPHLSFTPSHGQYPRQQALCVVLPPEPQQPPTGLKCNDLPTTEAPAMGECLWEACPFSVLVVQESCCNIF